MTKQAKNTICLRYDGGAEDAAGFTQRRFPIPRSVRRTAHRETFRPGRKGMC